MCKCKCGLNESVCNSKQKWSRDECWCECKELDDSDPCRKDYMWNTSTCCCKCNKACKVDECLDIKNCSCKRQLIGKPIVLAILPSSVNRRWYLIY